MAIELTKQAIATRLLKSAVRAFLRGDDPLAVYLLGATSARLLRDLSEARGIDWLAQTLASGIYYMAMELNEGRFQGPEDARLIIEKVANQISLGKIEGPEQVKVADLDPSARRQLLGMLNREHNFIKHADRDPLDSISEERIDPVLSVASACILFWELFPHVDVDEVTLFRYVLQRNEGRGYSADVAPYASKMDYISDEKLNDALLDFLAFVEREGL